jgi:AcrR family transcriptional regulator
MPRPRFRNLPREKRERILAVAAKEFAEHGFEGASLNHCLAAAGISKGAAYYYFDDKADLVATAVRHFLESMAGGLVLADRFDSPEAFWEEVAGFYRTALSQFEDSPWMLSLAKATWKIPREARGSKPLGALFRWVREFLHQLLHKGQDAGAIRTDLPEDLLLDILLAVDEASDHWLAENMEKLGAAKAQATVARLLLGVRRLLEPPKEARRGS